MECDVLIERGHSNNGHNGLKRLVWASKAMAVLKLTIEMFDIPQMDTKK